MKTFFNYPILIYLVATLACLCIMIIIDYILGVEAEHLNAWVIINRIFGKTSSVGDSLAIRKFGLFGATMIMISANFIFGIILIQLLKLIIRLFHS